MFTKKHYEKIAQNIRMVYVHFTNQHDFKIKTEREQKAYKKGWKDSIEMLENIFKHDKPYFDTLEFRDLLYDVKKLWLEDDI